MRMHLPHWVVYTSLSAAIALAGIGYYLWGRPAPSPYETVVATPRNLTEIVSVTGKVKPVQSVDLAFTIPGRIAAIDATVGQRVLGGASVARLDSADLSAAVAQAQANLENARAKLASLQAGTRPQDIQVATAAAEKAKQDLTNMYASIPDTLSSAYASANDAVRVQLAPLFSNADTDPQLTFSTSDSQASANAKSGRAQIGHELDAWSAQLASTSASSATTTLEAALKNGAARLADISVFLASVSRAARAAVTLPPDVSTNDALQALVAAAITKTNSATSAVNTDAQDIASQKLSVQQLDAALALKEAGSTKEDIAAGQAAVAGAQADLESAQAQLAKATLRAPFSGTITRQDGKAGETVAAAQTIASLMSSGGYEIEAYVAETDIASVKVGDLADVTLDAYGNTPFTAKVISIDPAETVIEGVSTYKVELAFVAAPEQPRSGMTANVDITTAARRGVIAIPARAVAQNGASSTVQVLRPDGSVEERPVTTGIRGSDGSIEITSGLSAGDRVITFTNTK